MGEGELPVDALIASLRSVNYGGFVSLEWSPSWCEEIDDIEIILSQFENFMSRWDDTARSDRSLYYNRSHTGRYVWEKDTLIDCTFSQVLDRMVEEFPDQLAFKYTTLNYTRTYYEFRRDVDTFAREVGETYTDILPQYTNCRGGIFQAGLYPVSANVPLGYQTGATPDGRLSNTPIADGVGPASGRDVKGPTATANSVARLDHGIASNGTLFNMKFHPSALEGRSGLESFVALVRGYFDQKGSHVQFNVVSRETLRDAQKNPENYKTLVVRVAGYSALFTTLSKSLQDDIIARTQQGW